MKFVLIFILAISSFAHAQTAKTRSKILPHNGGNGGDHLEINLKNTLIHISEFVKSNHGRILFKNDFDLNAFEAHAQKADVRVVDESLKNNCSSNDKEKMLIIISRECIESNVLRDGELYVALMGETLELMGVSGQVANKLLPVSGFIQKSISQIIFSNDCSLVVNKTDSKIEIPKMGIQILESKGFLLNQTAASISLNMSTIAISESEKSLVGNHSFSKSNFNGAIHLVLEGHDFEEYAPVSVKTKNQKASVKAGHGPALIETLLKMPSCMKI